MARSCEAAIRAGVTEIAFTDHVDHEPADMGFGYYRPAGVREAVARVQDRYGERLTILRGVEVDFNRRIADQAGRFLAENAFDFVIGSVHYGDAGQIIFPEYFDGKSLDDVFLPYFEEVQAAVETGWFDTIGHLDLPKRYAPGTHRTYDPLRYREALKPVFQSMIAGSVAFEINTSGLRQRPKTSMPGPAIVRWYVEHGGSLVTTGTDSHAAQTVGAGLPKTLDMLTLCGIDAVQSFCRRKRTSVSIGALSNA